MTVAFTSCNAVNAFVQRRENRGAIISWIVEILFHYFHERDEARVNDEKKSTQ